MARIHTIWIHFRQTQDDVVKQKIENNEQVPE